MERMSTCDLRNKEVINVCNGARLGCPTDFMLDICDGRIYAMIVPQSGGLLGVFGKGELIIPWDRIECIGDDAVLVRLPAEELCHTKEGKKKRSIW